MQSEHYEYKSQRKGRLLVAIVFTTILIVVIVVLGKGNSPRLWNGNTNKQDISPVTEMQQHSQSMVDDVASGSYRASRHEATDNGRNGDNGHSTTGHRYTEPRKMVAKLLSANGSMTLSMPCPKIFLSTEKLFSSDWIDPLLLFLSGNASLTKQVRIVAANDAYLDVLLNWLITATVVISPAMRNVLILALDKTMYDILHEREIPCIYVPLQSVLNESTRIMTSPYQRQQKALLMIRLAFLRILNWLGFDAASIDADALILKNPQPLFKNHKTDIVGSSGLPWPHEMFEKWNLTLCGGVIFIRSNKRTEEYWNTLSRADLFSGIKYEYDDQARINFGLNKLNITWKAGAQELHSGNVAVGMCQNHLTVTVLPPSKICRKCSENQRSTYYIWHHNCRKKQHQKMATAQKVNAWLLQKDWRKISRVSSLKGTGWLMHISNAKKYPLTA